MFKSHVQYRYLLLTVLFIWMAIGPLHYIAHDGDHKKPCEVCIQLSHQNVDLTDAEIFSEPFLFESESIQLFCQHYLSNFIATFYELRGPPAQLS